MRFGSVIFLSSRTRFRSADAIDDEVMKGALLSLTQGHKKFERLATDFSKKAVTMGYEEIIEELLEHEENRSGEAPSNQPPVQQLANAMSEPIPPTTTLELGEFAALMARMTKSYNHSKKTSSTELCRNFIAGRCKRPANECKFSHAADGTSTPSSSSGDGERRKITCYNCQKLGYHVANDCTEPKKERQRARPKAAEVANNTTEPDAGAAMTVADFMKKMCAQPSQAKRDGQGRASESEHAYALTEAMPSCAEQEAAASMYGSRYSCDVTGDGASRTVPPEADDGTDASCSSERTLSDDDIDDCPPLVSSDEESESDDSDDEQWPSAEPKAQILVTIHYYNACVKVLMDPATHDAGEAIEQACLSQREAAFMLTEVAFNTGSAQTPDMTDTVLLDSAASSHYLYTTDAPISKSGSIQSGEQIKVSGAQQGSAMQCFGKMACELNVNGGTQLKLNRCLLLPPTLRQRLASVGQLTKDGYDLVFHNEHCLVLKEGEVVAKVKRTANNLYPLWATNLPAAPRAVVPRDPTERAMMATENENGDSTEQAYLASTFYVDENFARRMHVKFNHASVAKGTRLYAKLEAVFGKRFTKCPRFSCSDCLTTKLHRLPHPRRSEKERAERDGGGKIGKVALDSFSWPFPGDKGEKVGTILTDRRLLIPIVTRTRDETPYQIIIRLKQLNKLAKHAEVLELSDEIFKITFGDGTAEEADAAADDLDLANIHYLMTDGAAELMGGELTEFCDANGIEKRASCPHTQQQNPGEPAVKLVTQGIALLHRQLPLKSKWPFAFKFFCHVYNLMPHMGLPGGYDTPYEAVKQRKVDFQELTKHVHPYGCLCFLHVPKALRAHTHGVDKGIPCANLGISTTKEGFVVLTLKSRTVINGAWDVFFVDDRFPIAELHAELVQQGLPSVKQQVSKRWAGVDLSWRALTTGDYSGEATTTDVEGEENTNGSDDIGDAAADTATEPDAAAATGSADTAVATPAKYTAQRDKGLGGDDLAEWKDMPRLDPPLPADRLPTAVSDSTMLQIKSALLHTRTQATNLSSAGEQASSTGLRRGARVRQPSGAKLTALANGPTTAPSPISETVTSAASPTEAGSPSLDIDMDECAMLASVQKEAAAASDASKPAPNGYKEAMRRSDRKRWLKVMYEHIMKLGRIKAGVYKMVRREEADNVMKSSWIYASKERAHHDDGKGKEDSARVVAGGYSQVYGVDYKETYCPTMSFETYKMSEAEALNDPRIIREEYDIKGAYYQTLPKFKQYMEQPPGMGETPESHAAIDFGSDTMPDFAPIPGAARKYVWELLTCFPGTKDAGHNFNGQLTERMKLLKLTPNPADSATFYGKFGSEIGSAFTATSMI